MSLPSLILSFLSFLQLAAGFVTKIFRSNYALFYHVIRNHLRNRKHVLCFYRVIQTRAAGECFQTFASVCITRQKHGVHVFYFFQKTTRRENGKQLVNFNYENGNSLCSRHRYVNSARQFCLHRVIQTRFLTNKRACFLRTVF